MKHALQILNVEKRKLINFLYEMQEHNSIVARLESAKQYTDDDFQDIKKKVAQTDDAIKLIETNGKKPKPVLSNGGRGA